MSTGIPEIKSVLERKTERGVRNLMQTSSWPFNPHETIDFMESQETFNDNSELLI
ncbi:MAG: hypothetical protein KBF73_03305 [Flavobacteriales bacterium]|nr:hypothetical protein [Flavobacteriales bacterium]